MRALLTISGWLEFFTGMALMALPSEVARILLGAPLDEAVGRTVARVAGAALMTIAFGCFISGKIDSRSAPNTLLGLMVYNGIVVIVLIKAYFFDHVHGIGLWPAAIAHTALAIWCIACFGRKNRPIGAVP